MAVAPCCRELYLLGSNARIRWPTLGRVDGFNERRLREASLTAVLSLPRHARNDRPHHPLSPSALKNQASSRGEVHRQ